MEEDELPPLQDFQEELREIQKKSTPVAEDYLKMNVRHVEDEGVQKQLLKKQEEEVKRVEGKLGVTKKEFGGMKKGFFSAPAAKPSIPQIKAKKNEPLRINEVQEAMKLNNYLEETKKDWMTEGFLNNVESNAKIQKLFSNPEYLKAIDMFKNNPKEAMAKYGGNKQFMEGFQEFCKLMGNQMQNVKKK